MNKKKMMALMALGLLFAGITVISAQIESNPASPTKACHIFPIKTPNREVYPSSIDVLESFVVGVHGDCNVACDFCDQLTPAPDVCIDHYGCNCYEYNGLVCKGKPVKVYG